MSKEDLNLQRQIARAKKEQYEYNEAQAQQAKERAEQDRVILKNLEKMNFSYDKQVQVHAKIVDNMIQQAELVGGMSKELRAYASLQNEVNQTINSAVQLQENVFTKTAGVFRDLAAAAEARATLQEKLNGYQEKYGKHLKSQEATEKRIEKITKKRKKLLEDIAEYGDEMDEASKETAAKALEQYNKEIDALKEAQKIKEVTAKLDEQKSVQLKAAALKGIEQAGKLATNYTENIFGKVQGIGAEMYKATGGQTSLIDTIQDAFTGTSVFPAELAKYGIGFEELSQSMVNLSQRSGEFATASAQVQKEIGLTTAKLERLGVSTETSADLFNTMRLNFGFSASEFGSMADEMVNNASAIGMSVEQYTQDFQSSFPVLSQHGTNAVRVFDNLARAAKASGMSVQELAQSMSQFDTFQSSAENASKLNFLLGSQLDTTQLLMADEAERLEMIKGAFSPAQFQNMDKFKKKAIAAAAGFSDVGAFEKAMRGDVDALGDLAKDNAEDLDSATQKSTAASLAFSKGLENAKDQAVLAIHDLSEVLGGRGQSLYATGKIVGAGMENMAGIIQLTSSTFSLFRTKLENFGSGGGGKDGGGFMDFFRDKDGNINLKGLMEKMSKDGFKNTAGKMIKNFPIAKAVGAAGAVGALGTSIYNMASSDGPVSGQQMGGMIGSSIGTIVGPLLGPIGLALGPVIGKQMGEFAGEMTEKAFGETKEEKKKREQNEARVQELLQENVDVARENARHAKKLAEDSEWNKNKANFRSVVGTRNAHMPTQRSNN